MKQHRTSLASTYVPSWGVQEAIRELFQNAIDHGDWAWYIERDKLTLTSKNASLGEHTLLLGVSEKKEGAIGKHGEGYKLAALVLAREGYQFYIHTGKETWQARLIDSKKYGVQQLVFDVWEHGDGHYTDIKIVVQGLKPEDIRTLNQQNLYLRGQHDITILNETFAGEIYVNGLYVCHVKDFKYGYNFKPDQLELDRDRRLVREFDLKWATSQLWAKSNESDEVLKMAREKKPDVEYVTSFPSANINNIAAKEFVDVNGPEAVPVVYQSEVESAKAKGLTPIVVPSVVKTMIEQSAIWTEPAALTEVKTPKEVLQEWFDKYEGELSVESFEDFKEILEQSEDWSN